MSSYRRNYVPGGTFFFTVVTHRRRDLFADAMARRLLGDIMRTSLAKYPSKVIAIVLLPDHLHAIWALYADDANYSRRWAWIKKEFTKQWRAAIAQKRASCHKVWQDRFWEHTIRDERDLENHFDYIHYNPVKHGFVESARDWPWSSFHRYVRAGHYRPEWGTSIRIRSLPGNAGE